MSSSTGLTRTLVELLRKAIAGELQDLHFALPGQVVRYNGTTNLADVQVMAQHPVFDDDNIRVYEDLGTLIGVPVKWPRFGGFYLSGPINAGDEGELIFHSTPIGEWRATGQSSKPQDASRHSIGWPTFSPTLFNDTRQLPDGTARAAGVVLGKEGSAEQILIQSGLIQAGASGAAPLPTQADYNALLAALTTFCTGLTSATVAANGAALKTALSAPPPSGCLPAFTTLFQAK